MKNKDTEAMLLNDNLFHCPICKSQFAIVNDSKIECKQGHNFIVENGLPLLYADHENRWHSKDVTEIIKSFYMENPFPDYEDLDSVGSLIDRSRRSIFAKVLDDYLPFGIRILEVGCGTGQMSIFLSLPNRQVFGVDLCPNSLQLARGFRDAHGLERVFFYQMNLFCPIFKEGSFDLVYCSGVLHHTTFPLRGFSIICRLVKPKRYIIIGLYNKYLRFPTHIRRTISRFIDIGKIDPILRRLKTEKKRQTWFNDQYRNPHESGHTITEVIKWFESNEIEFITSIPSPLMGKNVEALQNPFKPVSPKTGLEVVLNQLLSIGTFQKEGGLFLVVGKRKGNILPM